MAHQVLAWKPSNLSSVPGFHMVAEAWQPQVVSDRHMCTHIHINTQTNKVINNFNFFWMKRLLFALPNHDACWDNSTIKLFLPSLSSLSILHHPYSYLLSFTFRDNEFFSWLNKKVRSPLALWEYYLTQPSSFFVKLWFPYLSVSTTSYEAKDPQRQLQNEARMHAYRHTHMHMHTHIHT